MSLHAFLFYLIAGLTGLCAVSVVVSQNIVRAAAWLLFTLAGVAGVLFLLGAHFVGATQLLVYVGGTLVLVVFGVMLTAQGPFISMRTSAAEWAVSTVVGLLLYAVLVVAVVTRPMTFAEAGRIPEPGEELTSSTHLGVALVGGEDVTPKAKVTGVPAEKRKDLPRNGQRKQVSYLLPFEIVSVHLLVVLIGAAYLARAKRRRTAEQG